MNPHQHWAVQAYMNGTSGRSVTDRVLDPLVSTPAQTFFTDVTTRFFVKSGPPSRPQQADRIREVYEPFAQKAGLPSANLPPRPSPGTLVAAAIADERDRLRRELKEAGAPTVVTLGKEARALIERIVDDAAGAPTAPLRRDDPSYEDPGWLRLGGYRAQWYALTHPGNRNAEWALLQERWAEQVRNRRGR